MKINTLNFLEIRVTLLYNVLFLIKYFMKYLINLYHRILINSCSRHLINSGSHSSKVYITRSIICNRS